MRQLRKDAGKWLKDKRLMAGLSQMDLSNILGLKYYTFISQVENGFGRVPSGSMRKWARALGIPPALFARTLLATTTRISIVSCSRRSLHDGGALRVGS